MYVSPTAVKSHVNHLFAKAGLRDRAQAVKYAYRTGIATPPPRAGPPGLTRLGVGRSARFVRGGIAEGSRVLGRCGEDVEPGGLGLDAGVGVAFEQTIDFEVAVRHGDDDLLRLEEAEVEVDAATEELVMVDSPGALRRRCLVR